MSSHFILTCIKSVKDKGNLQQMNPCMNPFITVY